MVGSDLQSDSPQLCVSWQQAHCFRMHHMRLFGRSCMALHHGPKDLCGSHSTCNCLVMPSACMVTKPALDSVHSPYLLSKRQTRVNLLYRIGSFMHSSPCLALLSARLVLIKHRTAISSEVTHQTLQIPVVQWLVTCNLQGIWQLAWALNRSSIKTTLSVINATVPLVQLQTRMPDCAVDG